MDFDTIIDRRATNCDKWDNMERNYGVSPEDGLAMWVADTDFAAPKCIQDALRRELDRGVFGYYGDPAEYNAAIQWWMGNRHGWKIDPSWIFTVTGLGNGIGMCLDTYTKPGDGVVLLTPIYHTFARLIRASGRELVEMPLVNENGRYELDIDSYDAAMTGDERLMFLCSPHNPGGRVWSKPELQAIAAFAKRHDLILVSDEIHHDLVYPGMTHIPMSQIDGITDRLIMMTAASKTFNIAGLHAGNVIIEDPDLRARFKARMYALNIGAPSLGLYMVTAAYSPEGGAWVDDLVNYLDGNRTLFDEGVNAIPGVSSMPLEATFLSWVDFSGTGMDSAEFTRRVNKDAKIAANLGPSFGTGGEDFLRFNLGLPRARIAEAVDRLQKAFSDLQ
ncbi:MAG: pyridoxal phosphate-dependent aminotransferase [Litoreibacter sp.]|nr:pyridoxal phosphate-dependent aminotransferase [Litoreibacter sp.]